MQVTSGLRASRTWHVWLQRVHGRMRSGVPARSLATRSGSAIWARVISTASARAGSSSPPSAHSAWPTSTTDPCRTTGTSSASRMPGRQLDVEAGRLVEVGSGLLDGEDRAPHDDDVVDALGDERGGDAGGRVRRDPGPGGQLVARQPQPDDVVGAGGPAHGGDDVAAEAEPVAAPLVAALVGQTGQELAHEAVLAGVDLDAVAPGRDRPLGGGAEPADDGGDVGRLHPLRHLARRHLGHPRRRPQRALAVGRRALPAGVVERRPARAPRGGGRPRRSRPTRPRPRSPAAPARTASRTSWTLAPSTTIVPHPPRARRS